MSNSAGIFLPAFPWRQRAPHYAKLLTRINYQAWCDYAREGAIAATFALASCVFGQRH
jgi:hypothetical protein